MITLRRARFIGSCGLFASTTLAAFASVALAQGQPPIPLPSVAPAPLGNPVTTAKANLGKVLFWDEQLSSNGSVACGTCHVSSAGGSDPRTAQLGPASVHPGADRTHGTADDVFGSPGVTLANANGSYALDAVFRLQRQITPRRSMSVINTGFVPLQFWSGRAPDTFKDPITGAVVIAQGASLETQVLEPSVSAAEMGHLGRNWTAVAAKIAGSTPLRLASNVPPALAAWINGRSYPALFQEAFGSLDVMPVRIAMAIATYERTLVSNQTPYDAFLGGNSAALTPLETQGLQVFNGVGRCNVCHTGPLLSDNLFHYNGVRPHNEDRGRAYETGLISDRGAMRTSSLRNVELRPPYFHNGRMANLSEVIDFYDRGGDFTAANKAPSVAPIGLTAGEKAALLAFLTRPLTDPRVAAEIAPFDRPTLASETNALPAHYGAPTPGAGGIAPTLVAFEPALIGAPMTIGIDGGHAGKEAVLLMGTASLFTGLPFQGSSLHVDLGSLTQVKRIGPLNGIGVGKGWGSATAAVANDPQLIGTQIFAQWLVIDPLGGGQRLCSTDAVAITHR